MRTPIEQWLAALRDASERETLAFFHARIAAARKRKGRWPGPGALAWAGAAGISEAAFLGLLLHLADTHAWAWDQLHAHFCVLRAQGKPLPPALTAWALGNFERAQARHRDGWRKCRFVADRIGTYTLPRPADNTAHGQRDFWLWAAYRYLRSQGRNKAAAVAFLTTWERGGLYALRPTGPARIRRRTVRAAIDAWERARPDRQIAEKAAALQRPADRDAARRDAEAQAQIAEKTAEKSSVIPAP